MTRIQAYDFLGLYTSILADVSAYHPKDQIKWEQSIESLTHLYQTRGQPIFTIDLPALGKLLDRSLATGFLVLNGNLTKPIKGTKIPRLFSGLWMKLFDNSGILKADIDPNDVFFLRTLCYVGKNLEWNCSPRYLYETVKEWYDVESQLPVPSPYWDGDSSLPVSDLSDFHHLDRTGGAEPMFALRPQPEDNEREPGYFRDLLLSVQRDADRMAASLGEYIPEGYAFRHGPGAVSDLRRGSYKYSFPSWSPRLETNFPYDRFGLSGMGLLEVLDVDGIDYFSKEEASKLIDVPKTQKGPRLIAAEPTCHQWVQQSIKDFLYSRVKETYIGSSVHFDDQKENQEYARLGSIDGSFATIDLKSASDRLSCSVVERVFRRNPFLLECMRDSRTRYIRNGIDKKQPELHKLRKFSTQGSALTFPVQSLVFFSIAMGVGRHHSPRKSTRELAKLVRVFGDDIIVPEVWVDDVIAVLHALGLKVNESKTFREGNFRESCGFDAWQGYDVTPPHITRMTLRSNPMTVASNVAISNNFHRKGLWSAASWIMTRDMPGEIPVVHDSLGEFGFKSFTGSKYGATSKTRYNTNLQRFEVRTLAIVARVKVQKQNSPAALLQYFTEEPDPYIDYESGVAVGGVPVFKHAWVDVSRFQTMESSRREESAYT